MTEHQISRRQALKMVVGAIAAAGLGPAQADEEGSLLANAGFEGGALTPWLLTEGTAQVVGGQAHGGGHALALGPGPSAVAQTVPVRPDSTYHLTGWLRSGSGAEEVRLGVQVGGGAEREAAVPRVTFTEVTIEFATGATDHEAVVFLRHPTGPLMAYADDLALRYVGPAAKHGFAGTINSITVLPVRVPKTDLGIAQQPNEKLNWLLDAKFGMFIHWGLYAGPGQGEWYMHNAAIPPDQYRKYAFPESGDEYFAADKYDPGH